MEEYQKRMVDELSELQDRIEKLDAFLATDKFAELDLIERTDLICQEHAMVLYERFLGSRCLRAGLISNDEETENK